MVSEKIFARILAGRNLLLFLAGGLLFPGGLFAQEAPNTALLEKTVPETVKLQTPPEKGSSMGSPDEAEEAAALFAIQSLKITKEKSLHLQVWNPLEEPLKVKLYDLYGKRLFDEDYPGVLGRQSLVLDFKWLPEGTYYLMVRCGSFQKMLQVSIP
ncbi:MAG: hypothetical protein D6765_06315 [Bacteroidetes bacterium]|nr:MAG: hypothetical protein D6765_06315 [Bacteroidota bacterium]